MSEHAKRNEVLEMLSWITEKPKDALAVMTQEEIDTCHKKGFLPDTVWENVSQKLLSKK